MGRGSSLVEALADAASRYTTGNKHGLFVVSGPVGRLSGQGPELLELVRVVVGGGALSPAPPTLLTHFDPFLVVRPGVGGARSSLSDAAAWAGVRRRHRSDAPFPLFGTFLSRDLRRTPQLRSHLALVYGTLAYMVGAAALGAYLHLQLRGLFSFVVLKRLTVPQAPHRVCVVCM